jgi:hypothetical protein
MLYDGVPVDLTPEQEEVATFFAVMKETGGWRGQVPLGWSLSRASLGLCGGTGVGGFLGPESLPIAHRTTSLSAHTTPAKFRPAPHQLSFAAPFALAHGGHQSCWCHSVTNYTAHSGPAGLYNTAFHNLLCTPPFLPADYMNKPKFLENFWEGFREVLGPRHVIKGLDK